MNLAPGVPGLRGCAGYLHETNTPCINVNSLEAASKAQLGLVIGHEMLREAHRGLRHDFDPFTGHGRVFINEVVHDRSRATRGPETRTTSLLCHELADAPELS